MRRLTRWTAGRATVACLALFVLGTSAAADVRHVNAVEAFALADQALQAGQSDSAIKIYRALALDPNLEIRTEARFRGAMLLVSLKRDREAATLFRALLDEKPDALRARLELAGVLARMGDVAGARRELRQAQATGLPPDVALIARRFSQALRSAKSFGGSFDVALAPDSNINRATAATTLDTVIAPLTLSKDARQQSGLGLRLLGQAYARASLGENLSLAPRVAAQADLYRTSRFDDVSASALIGIEWRLGRDTLTPSAGETRRWYGGGLYASTDTIALDWQHPLGLKAEIEAQLSGNRVRYETNPLQDGMIYAGSLALERAFGERSGGALTVDVVRQAATDPGYSTWSAGLSVLGWRTVGRNTLFLNASIHHLVGDERLFLFPDRRVEYLFQASGGVTMRKWTWHGLAPFVRLGFERNVSTVGIYDYGRVVGQMGLTHAF